MARDLDRANHPREWMASRRRAWSREAAAGRPVRIGVQGDLFYRDSLDRQYLAMILGAARTIPGFRGWIFTHVPPDVLAPHLKYFRRCGIIVRASVHGTRQMAEAAAHGFPWAMIVRTPAKALATAPDVPGAIRCPHQCGAAATCLDCGVCFKTDRNIVLGLH
jgi:hypothetical protein